MGRCLTRAYCPSCLGLLEWSRQDGGPGLFFECEVCARHFEREAVDYEELDTATGELVEARCVVAVEGAPAQQIAFKLRGDEEWVECSLCGEPTAFFKVHGGRMSLVNRDGTLHSRSCAGFLRDAWSRMTKSADQLYAESVGQFSMELDG